MGHFTGPRSKIARRFGEPIFGPDKVLEKRPNPPGQHGANKRRKKVSEYGQQLAAKQKAKAIYGMRAACSLSARRSPRATRRAMRSSRCASAASTTSRSAWAFPRPAPAPVSS